MLISVLLAEACDQAPADLREWQAADHDRVDEQQPAGRAARPPRGQVQPSASADPTTTLVEVTWRNQCAACHGMLGRGDGPQGPMVRAPDLTAVEWQAKVTDQQIAEVIQAGKNRMPKFDFPPDVVKGLVARIRGSRTR
jgi:mono/diheme cytochrome c family protein